MKLSEKDSEVLCNEGTTIKIDANLKDVLPFAKSYIGSKYVFGIMVPKHVPNYKGAFDCAEFVAYCIGQQLGVFGYGTRNDDAYTGFFGNDAESKGIIIPVTQAAKIPGAILLRKPKGGAIGHIVFSQGNGKTIEAHSTKYGVIESVVDGRRWDYGILLPGIAYSENVAPVNTKAPVIVYRLKTPLMEDPFVRILQTKLKEKGYYMLKLDDYFGPGTQDAVVRFQKAYGLVVDGEVMPGGETAKALGIK